MVTLPSFLLTAKIVNQTNDSVNAGNAIVFPSAAILFRQKWPIL